MDFKDDDAARKTSNTVNTAADAGLERGVQGFGEAFDENNGLDLLSREAMEAYIYGAITAGLVNAPNLPGDYKNNRLNAKIDAYHEALQEYQATLASTAEEHIQPSNNYRTHKVIKNVDLIHANSTNPGNLPGAPESLSSPASTIPQPLPEVKVNPGARQSVRELAGDIDTSDYRVPKLPTPSEIFVDEAGVPLSKNKYPSALRKYMLKLFKGKVLKIGSDHKVYISRDGIKEYNFPVKRLNEDIKTAKQTAGASLDKTLEPAMFLLNTADDGRHADAVGGWDNFYVMFDTDSGRYSGVVKTKNTAHGREFYDITEIQKESADSTTHGVNEVNPPPATKSALSNPTIPQGGTGVNTSIRESAQNDTTKNSLKRSKFYDSIQQADTVAEEVKQRVQEAEAEYYYREIANEETMKKAAAQVEQNVDAAGRRFSAIEGNATTDEIAQGFVLLKKYQDMGDYDAAADIAHKLSEIATKTGQQLQIYSILGRMTPEGMLRYAAKELETMKRRLAENPNRWGTWLKNNADKLRLTAEDAEKITAYMERAQAMPDGRDKVIMLAEIQKLLQSKLPSTLGSKLSTLQRISLLLNPKTVISRNALSNVLMNPIYAVSDFAAAGADRVIGAKTGIRTVGAPNYKDQAKGWKKGAFESYDDFRRAINTRDIQANRFEISNKLGSGPAFKGSNPMSKALAFLDRTTGFLLDVGDRPFFEGYFLESLNGQMRANKTDTPTPDMIDIATQTALEKTWQDDITISSAVATNGTRYMRAHLLLQNIYYPIRHDGSIQDEPFQDGNESYLQTLYKLDGTVQQRRREAYGANPNVWSAWETIGQAHTHANASILSATTAAYTTAEKTKLSGIAAGANNYVHPASHSADMISTTASKRFTSDAEMAQKADKNYVDSGLADKADGAAVYAALDTKADKTAVEALEAKAHAHANASVLDTITPTSLVRTQDVALDSSLTDVTDLDSLPNGLTQIPYNDGPGAGGYLVFTSVDPYANVGFQIKLSKDATLWRGRSYDGWGAWLPQTDALLAPIVTKTDAGTSFFFGAPGIYSLARTTDAAKQLSFYTPSVEQKTKVNELELYLTVTAGDSVLWPAGTLFTGGEIPTFTPGHYYRVIVEYHPLAQAWCVGVIEDFAAA